MPSCMQYRIACSLGPIATWMLKYHVDTLAPFLIVLVNDSLFTGVVPVTMKQAHVTPLLKKPTLDQECMTSLICVKTIGEGC